MPLQFFPDNTVLINFAYINRYEILKWFLRGNGAWTISTSRECSKSSRYPELEQMNRWQKLLPSPLMPEAAELVDAKTIATQLLKPGFTDPAKNMGEAETIAIITRRQIEAVFLTDDYDAARRAQAEPLIKVASTTKVLALAEVMGQLSRDEARRDLAHLRNRGRVLGNPPSIANYDDYVRELQSRRRISGS